MRRIVFYRIYRRKNAGCWAANTYVQQTPLFPLRRDRGDDLNGHASDDLNDERS